MIGPAKVERFRIFAFLCVFLGVVPCFGALGGDASSVQSDAAHLQGSVRFSQAAAYKMQEIKTPTGITVHEFVSPSGRVFAVAWQGPWLPDLQQLLGAYFTQYQQAAQATKRSGGRSPLAIRQSNLVVEQSGHMRSFIGRAYLTDQLPSGVTAEAIR